jgi:hypothetical protein
MLRGERRLDRTAIVEAAGSAARSVKPGQSADCPRSGQTRWTRTGAQYLRSARTAMLNGDLVRYTGIDD